MIAQEPITEVDRDYSSPDGPPTPWHVGRDQMAAAPVVWLTTVRPDGRPHVTPIAIVWLDDALHFVTGRGERKARNLETNRHVIVTTGTPAFAGVDVVIEGEAVPVTDPSRLAAVGAAYPPKYGDVFRFEVRDGLLRGEGSDDVLAFAIQPVKGFAFRRDEPGSETRWLFR